MEWACTACATLSDFRPKHYIVTRQRTHNMVSLSVLRATGHCSRLLDAHQLEDCRSHSLIYALLRINHLIGSLCSNRRHPDFERICLIGRNLLCERSFVIVVFAKTLSRIPCFEEDEMLKDIPLFVLSYVVSSNPAFDHIPLPIEALLSPPSYQVH